MIKIYFHQNIANHLIKILLFKQWFKRMGVLNMQDLLKF